ncbi:acetyltransferase [Paraglaciecola aestuariivivens]
MVVSNNQRLVIIGSGGHGKVAADCAQLTKQFSEIVFLDALYPELTSVANWQVVGHQDQYLDFAQDNSCFFVAIGNNATRASWQQILQNQGCQIATLVHPKACVATDVSVGLGTLILAGAVVNTCTQVGAGSIINTGATVDHDSVLGTFTHLAPGVNLAGCVTVGHQTFVGIGSVAIQGVTIGQNTTVGAGSTVIEDLPAYVTAVGTPAEVIKNHE